MPTPDPAGTPGWFTHGSPPDTPYTVLTSDWANAVQAELIAVITAAGLSLDKTDTSQLLAAIQTLERIKLTATLNLYVSPSGSDSNDGLTSDTPFGTLQKAWDYAASSLDLAANDLNINLADGTYTTGVKCSGHLVGQRDHLVFASPGGNIPAVSFVGDTGAPQNVIINTPTGNCFSIGDFANIAVSGMTLVASSVAPNAGCGIMAHGGARCYIGAGMRFGACASSHVLAQRASSAIFTSNYSIVGGAISHLYASTHGEVSIGTVTVTLTGTPAFTLFAYAVLAGLSYVSGVTFSGSATGTRYAVADNGTIYTGTSGSSSYLPGSINGSATTGGIYD